MAKVTIQDVTDAGFRAEQFGTPADWAAGSGTPPAPGYVDRVIADAATYVADRVGAEGYAAATGAQALRLKRAELCWVKAELWRRRAAFLDSNAFTALEGNPSAANERRNYEEQAQAAEACVLNNIDLFLSDGDAAALGSGASVGHVETGPYVRPTRMGLVT